MGRLKIVIFWLFVLALGIHNNANASQPEVKFSAAVNSNLVTFSWKVKANKYKSIFLKQVTLNSKTLNKVTTVNTKITKTKGNKTITLSPGSYKFSLYGQLKNKLTKLSKTLSIQISDTPVLATPTNIIPINGTPVISPPPVEITPTASPIPTFQATATPTNTYSFGTKVIANWDIVPFQLFSNTINIGVVAFHESGLSVKFYVNDIYYQTVSEPSYNTQTGVWEYFIQLNAASFNDGPISVASEAIPSDTTSLSKTLSPITLYANANGSLTNSVIKYVDCSSGSDSNTGSINDPYLTIGKAFIAAGDGGTIYLKPGTCYSASTNLSGATNYQQWTTIMPAPGVSREQVLISGGQFKNKVHWKSVRINKTSSGYGGVMTITKDTYIWFDQVEMFDAGGRWNNGEAVVGTTPYYAYFTNSYIHDIQNVMGKFHRGSTIEHIGSDIFRGSNDLFAVNVTVRDIDAGNSGAHPDFIQFYNPDVTVDNIILYNVQAYDMNAQGVFGATANGWVTNFAMVNVLLEKDPPTSFFSSQTLRFNHWIAWHITTVDSSWILTEPDLHLNCNIRNNSFSAFGNGTTTSLPNSQISHNHFKSFFYNQPSPLGSEATTGDPVFNDPDNDDFAPSDNSPLKSSGTSLPGVPADIFGNLYDTQHPSRGAIQ